MRNIASSLMVRMRQVTLAGIALLVLAVGVVVPMVQPAAAQGQVSISGELDANAGGSLQLQGSGFQSVQNGFGGIYVLFGWVDGGSWRPSQGGVTGQNYRYVYDDESKPEGFQLFVTFPGSSTAYAANGGQIAADGTWSGTLKVPGAVFNTFDRQNNETQVNCMEVQCGVITIGAHGVKNANNESFTPVNFTGTAAADTAPQQQQQNNQEAGTVPSAQATTNPTAAATAAPGATQATAGQVLVTGNQNNGWDIVAIVLIVIVALSILALACGIGGYLAAKSLLLGVNPAALEKVRGQRERKALAQREKEERKTADLERKHRIRTARQLQQEQAALGREALRAQPDAGNGAHPRQGAGGSPTTNESFDQVVQFFRRDDAADLPLDHRGASEPEAKTEVLTPDVRNDAEGGVR